MAKRPVVIVLARLALGCAALGCAALGCATKPVPAPVAPAAQAEPAAATAPPETEPEVSPRALGARATFGDLVRVARSLASSPPPAEQSCLLGREGSGFVLAAELMPSLERMPDPPSELGARFERGADAFAVLTAWGIGGSAQATTLLAAFTATQPTALGEAPTLLVLDGDAAYVRAAADRSEAGAAALPIEHAVARAKQLTPGSATLYVTASAGLPLEELATVLGMLDTPPAHAAVALAVLLPTDTALPSLAPPALSAELCPNGLPEVDETTPLGDLSRATVMPALAGLQESVAPCLSALRVQETRVVIALRVGESGGVQRACFLEQGALDPRTASCVLLVAGALELSAPNPRGVVDLHLPLTLTAGEGPGPQRALCAP
jgi:hypothetical protein